MGDNGGRTATVECVIPSYRRQIYIVLAGILLFVPRVYAVGSVAATHTIDKKEQVGSAAPPAATRTSPVKIGGALRFNYYIKSFDKGLKSRRGELGFDIFRIAANGKFGKLYLSADYRFYTYMNAIQHGYVGYRFNDHLKVQAGITRVPFGLLPYAAHNYWFGVPYYMGLADAYHSGIKVIEHRGPWNLQAAFFKNASLGNASDLNRSSYDPVAVGAAANEETNTFVGRLAYTIGNHSICENEIGVSAKRGQLFNVDTEQNGSVWAGAVHFDSHCGRWNFQIETARYGFDPANPAGVPTDTITLGGFGGSFAAAASGNLYVANVAYNLPVTWPALKLLTCYNDFSQLDKNIPGAMNSAIDTTGCLIHVGPTYTYIDLIRAHNMVYFGNGSLAGGGVGGWKTRFNVNFGIYW